LLGGAHTAEEAKAARDQVETALTEYRELQAQIRVTSPRYAALTQPEPLSADAIQREVLDSDTLLLEYALGEERSFVWAVTPSEVHSYVLPARKTIEGLARRVYSLLTERNRKPGAETTGQKQRRLARAEREYADAVAELSRVLLGPVASDLGRKRLLVVADGALHYLPFPALLEGPRAIPVVENREVVSAPSASTLAVLRREAAGRRPPPKAVAVIADPVFDPDDVRVSRARRAGSGGNPASLHADLLRDGAFRLSRLPFSRREAAAIFHLVPSGSSLRALDFDASRATVTSGALAQYRLVHFATHGILNTEHPELSGLVLSLVDQQGRPQDGFLRLHDTFNLQAPAEAVVLSACQTGLGQEIRGEGLIGLTRGFMYGGAKRVVASLWKVDDEATAEFMAIFYRGMLGPQRLRPAAALREAQIAIRRNQRWQSPYYWAAFVLQGEWR
jgi:CHAT domain-containing protein